MNRTVASIAITALVLLAAIVARAEAQADSSRSGGALQYERLRADGNEHRSLMRQLSLDRGRLSLEDALRALAREAGVGLTYDPELAGLDRSVTLRLRDVPAAQALLDLLRGSDLEVLVSASGQTLLVRRRPDDDRAARGAIRGVASDTSGARVDNVRVQLVGSHLGAVSDGDGRFTIRDVPAGRHTVRAIRLGYRAVDVELVVPGGGEAPLVLHMEAAATPLAQVVVTPGYFGVMEQTVAASQSLSREQLETAPQLAEDTFRAVSRLPGVSSSDITSAFRVRGGSNDELLITLDGLQLYEPFHLKDFDAALSIVDIDALSGMELVTGGFGARYGDRLTGLFHMHTDELASESRRTTLALTLTNLRAASQGRFAADRGQWLLSARHGYIDYALDLADSNLDISPRYYDVLGKVQYRLGDGHTLSLHGLHAGDRLDYRDEPEEPVVGSSYGSSYAWATWNARVSERADARTLVSTGHLSWHRLGDHTSSFDGVRDVFVDDDRTLSFVGLRQDWSLVFGEDAMLTWSIEARRLSSDYDYLQWQRRLFADADTLASRLDTIQVVVAPRGTVVGAHVSQRVRPWKPLTIEAGVRYDRHSYLTGDHVSPRLNVALDLGLRTTLRAAWGRYTQGQGLHELQVQDGIGEFHDTEVAQQRVVGAEHLFASGVVLRAEVYQRKMSNPRPRLMNLANELELVPEIEDDRLLYVASSGEARGIELFAKREVGERIDWSASYAYAVAEDIVDGRTIPRLFDQRHTFYADVAYKPSGRWRFSAAWQYHSGWPYTPIGFQIDSVPGRVFITQRTFGAINSERLPSYHRMDVRVMRTFHTRRGRVLAYVDIFNLLNRRNPRAPDVQVASLSPFIVHQGIDPQLPRLPSFGVIWEF
ncbi:MAG TPA: TonB-dependent receptor [Gemmatimonadaceae bacterium]|nr:TonB-dependent receptor [Gemmatimonadaceae bacterium]